MPRRHLPLLLAGLALAGALAGCSADRDVLIRAGSQVVTLDEFRTVARGNEAAYPGPPDSAKRALYEDLLRRTLLLREAEERGLFADSVTLGFRRETERQILQRELFRRMSPSSVPVSDAEVARMMTWRDTLSRLHVIYTVNRAAANQALSELRRGRTFEDVANQFNVLGVLPPGGDLGPMQPGQLVDPLDRVLRTAPLNRVVGPLEAPGEGWFLLKVSDRMYRPSDQPAEVLRPMVRGMLEQRKARSLAFQAYDDLRRGYRIEVTPGAADYLYQRYNTPFSEIARQMGGEEVLPPPAPEDLPRTMVTWDGGPGYSGRLTLSDLLDALERGDEPPPWSQLPLIGQWITNQALQEVSLVEARRRGLDREPAVRRAIEQQVNGFVLDNLYQSDIVAETRVTPEDVKAYYETVRDQFQRLDRVVLKAVSLADSAAAHQVALHGGHAASMEEALTMASVDATVEDVTVDYPSEDPDWAALQATFTSLNPGELAGPYQVAGTWRLYRIESKDQAPEAWERLSPGLVQLIESQAAEARRDQVLQRMAEHYRTMYKPEEHPERLKRIPWPVDPPKGPAS
jgi:hypothetical protein